VPNFNIYFKIKYKVSTKSLEAKKIKNKKNLCRVPNLTLGKEPHCRMSSNDTRQRLTVCTIVSLCRVPRFADCLALGKEALYRVSDCAECRALGKERLYRVPCCAECGSRQRASLPSAMLCRVRLSAKRLFAECPSFGTRQNIWHSAKFEFPVAIHILIFSLRYK